MFKLDVKGQKELEKRIQRAARWSVQDAARLKAINERVGKVYTTALLANVRDAETDIKVYNTTGGGPGRKKGQTGTVKQVIKRGTLRRSIKVFQRRNKVITYAGPKSKGGKKGRGTKTTRTDGWFANIVDQGAGFGPGRNKGLFTRTQKATRQRMVNLRNRLLQKEFQRFMR